jgi:predicted amidophosphoribosyltransferase
MPDYYTASTYNEWQRATANAECVDQQRASDHLSTLPAGHICASCGKTFKQHMVPAFCTCGAVIPTKLPEWLTNV